MIVYHDVLEMLAEGAVIDLSSAISGDLQLSHLLVAMSQLFSDDFSEAAPGLFEKDEFQSGSRVFFNNFSIRMTTDGGEELRVSAKRGRLSFGPDMLVLEGRILMLTPSGEVLRSPSAAITDDFDGIHLPYGYELGGERFARGGLVLASEGELARARELPRLEIGDMRDRTERKVLQHLAKNAPAGLRHLVSAFVAHLGPGSIEAPLP
jgi:hypothetical protein